MGHDVSLHFYGTEKECSENLLAGECRKKGGRIVPGRGLKVMTDELTETADLGSWEHQDCGPIVRESAWDKPRPSA